MYVTQISVEPAVAEYAMGKFYDEAVGAVRFPASSDIYVLLYDLMQKRPITCPVDRGNLSIALPDRREGNTVGGKSPEQYNYLSARSQALLEKKLRIMMWAELHDFMDEGKHLRGVQFKESVYIFMKRYGIDAISEDALIKNYQRWRDRMRKQKRRDYVKKRFNF